MMDESIMASYSVFLSLYLFPSFVTRLLCFRVGVRAPVPDSWRVARYLHAHQIYDHTCVSIGPVGGCCFCVLAQ